MVVASRPTAECRAANGVRSGNTGQHREAGSHPAQRVVAVVLGDHLSDLEVSLRRLQAVARLRGITVLGANVH